VVVMAGGGLGGGVPGGFFYGGGGVEGLEGGFFCFLDGDWLRLIYV